MPQLLWMEHWKTYFPTMAILDYILTSLSQETHEIIMATFIQQNLGSAVSTNGCSQITKSMQ